MGGSRHCTGKLEVKHEDEWYPVNPSGWEQKLSSIACRQLNCGPAVSAKWTSGSNWEPAWWLIRLGGHCRSTLRECGSWTYNRGESRLELICSGNKQCQRSSACSRLCDNLILICV